VAFSGGADSVALLAALATLRRPLRLRLRALHVNHHLQASADRWAREARQQAARLRVPARVLNVEVAITRGASVEAAARRARYAALAQALKPGEWLLTAHHREDQFETLLLQLLRGAGLAGLAAMPERSAFAAGWLLRPLLPMAREELRAYLRRRRLGWSEDPSNADERFDRNYLRRQILPRLEARWPAAAVTAGRAARHAAEAQQLLDEWADAQLVDVLDGEALQVPALRRLMLPARRLLLRRWLRRCGLVPPDQVRLQEIAVGMLAARHDAAPAVRWDQAEVLRHGGHLYAHRPLPPPPLPQSWSWRREHWRQLPGAGRIGLVRDAHGPVQLDALPARFELRFRSGGERLPGAAGRGTLKDLLQQSGLPPWRRARLPLLYAGERLLAVADLWLAPELQASAQSKHRARLLWEAAAD
jgi:tRNA(Ile)-lysidine synthase